MQTRVMQTVLRWFASLRQMLCIMSFPWLLVLVVALVHSQLNYSIAVLVGLPVYLQRCLQSVSNGGTADLSTGIPRPHQ